MPKKPTNYTAPALEKGLDVIELLSWQPDGFTKSQLARELKKSSSELFRMLLCLERRGYIVQIGDRYALTLKLFQISHNYSPIERLIAEARPDMNDLASKLLQNCHLAVLDGTEVVTVAQTQAPTQIGLTVRVGAKADLMESTGGAVLLAYSSPDRRALIIEEWLRKTGKRPPRNLGERLTKVCDAGYATSHIQPASGLIEISAPILGSNDVSLAVLTVNFIQQKQGGPQLDAAIEALQDATFRIGGIVGGKRYQA